MQMRRIDPPSWASCVGTKWVQACVTCHCLEPPKPGMERCDDYLGLDVWLKRELREGALFEVYRTPDSSVI